MNIPSELISVVERHAFRKASPAVQVLIDDILARHGQAVQGVLFYGSCLRSGDDLDGLVDLYLLVDSYRKAYKNFVPALLNALLPPNVFYLQREFEGRMVRTKYAVLSLADFQKGTSKRWFHSYLWGRFSQPTAILYTRNAKVTELVLKGFACAIMTFIHRVLPRISPEFTARRLWGRGFELSYRAELRAERPEKRARLFDAAPQYYEEVTRFAAEAGACAYDVSAIAGTDPTRYRSRIAGGVRWVSRLTWGLRSWQGKLLSVLRLVKAITTFEGGVDYILWKINRHSGVSVDVEPRLRRHPLLAMWVLSWRLYRRGGFR